MFCIRFLVRFGNSFIQLGTFLRKIQENTSKVVNYSTNRARTYCLNRANINYLSVSYF